MAVGAGSNASYVWYEKGGQIMFTLADYIGEDKVDLALHNFLMQYRYANAANQLDAAQKVAGSAAEDEPYPDTRQLIEALRAQTPPELQYLIDDGFDRIVLYDNKAISATSQRRSDGKHSVTLAVQARKVQADGNGVESAMPLADYIDIGVFTGQKDEEKPLYMRREKLTQEHQTFIIADQRPTRAGYRSSQQTDRPHCGRQYDRRERTVAVLNLPAVESKAPRTAAPFKPFRRCSRPMV